MITINPEKLVKNANTSGELIFRGGLALQAELGAQNVQRFAKSSEASKASEVLRIQRQGGEGGGQAQRSREG